MSSALPPSAAAGSSAEAQAAAFADDPRVYFNKETNTWRLEQDDDSELEYDAAKGVWLPVVDDDLIRRQQAAYSVAGVDEETPAAPVLKRESKKRKAEDYTGYGNSTAGASGSSATSVDTGPSAKRGKNEKQPRSKNTAVYVTGLPTDTDPDELVDRFSKCGVIEEDDNGEPKIKMYAREDGMFSGEALIVYFKEDSVILAVNLLDEDELRRGDPSTRMSVAKADFAHKAKTGGHGEGTSQPRKTIDKKAATRRIGKMRKKLEEWGDDDGFGPQPDPADSLLPMVAKSRVVVLKHMFRLEDLEKDATLLLDLKEDVREECSMLGEVTNVTLYDKEPDGIMTVKFKDTVSAQACIIKMNGRFFDGQRVIAELFTGNERFKRSGARDDAEDGQGDAEEKARLEDFAKWLMEEGE